MSQAKGVELYTVQSYDSQKTLKLSVGATHDQIRSENMLSTSNLLIQSSINGVSTGATMVLSIFPLCVA